MMINPFLTFTCHLVTIDKDSPSPYQFINLSDSHFHLFSLSQSCKDQRDIFFFSIWSLISTNINYTNQFEIYIKAQYFYFRSDSPNCVAVQPLPPLTKVGPAVSLFLCSGIVSRYTVRQILGLSLVHFSLKLLTANKKNLLTENVLYCTLTHSSRFMRSDLHSNLHSRIPNSNMVQSLSTVTWSDIICFVHCLSCSAISTQRTAGENVIS